jgi:hypothetical protein
VSATPPGAPNADVVASLRRMARPRAAPAPPSAGGDARCDLCGARMSEEHRHLLDVHERRIVCACEPCCAMRSGEDDLRPTGTRTLRLEGFELSDELWAQFQIPIGLAFFFVSDEAGGVAALYPSPAWPSSSRRSRRSSSTGSPTRPSTRSCRSIAATSSWG